VDFEPGTDSDMESMLGFSQDLGFAGSVQSVAAVSVNPDVESAAGRGLDEATVRSEETMHFGPAIDAEAGANLVWGRLNGLPDGTATAMLPHASVAWHSSNSSVHYSLATMVPNRAFDASEVGFFQPALVLRNGELGIERGTHQEIGWERRSDASGAAIAVFADSLQNPVFEALDRMASGSFAAPSGALLDPASHLLRAAGPAYSTAGVTASVEHRLPGNNSVRAGYATGSAFVMPALPRPSTMSEAVAAARPRRTQTFSIALTGTIDGTGTRWRASYSWQPDDTVTEVAPFAANAALPFLNVQLRQPIYLMRDGSGGFEALLDVRNLLSEGYTPYILSDGSLLIFAQDQRSVRAGLAFTF